MVTRTFLSPDGSERLVVSTICTHLPFFHEAGFVYRTERRERPAFAPWKPATWRGDRWSASADAAQPTDLRCVFVQRGGVERDIGDFDVTTQAGDGVVKLSCDHMMARAHCIHVVGAEQPASVALPHEACDARSVVNVCLHFIYGGDQQVVCHSPRRSVSRRPTYVDNASTPAR